MSGGGTSISGSLYLYLYLYHTYKYENEAASQVKRQANGGADRWRRAALAVAD